MQSIEVSAGIRLTPLDVADADALFDLTDANRRHLRIWLPWVDAARCAEDTRAWIRTSKMQASRNEGVQFAVRVDSAIAGVIGHHRIDWPNRCASLGYWLGEAYQGRGLATAACRSLVAHAFDVLQLNRVEIRCAVGNRRSCAIPRRLDFREEGVLREAQWLYDHFVDHVVYGMLASDWRRANLGV
ncbi:MAG: GNAT family protein [Bryobacterales bacterium]|nr:GNAT family protein [Bryobacterales bacterium]